jgi:hypothetical protein
MHAVVYGHGEPLRVGAIACSIADPEMGQHVTVIKSDALVTAKACSSYHQAGVHTVNHWQLRYRGKGGKGNRIAS